jgi:hypothetical protein
VLHDRIDSSFTFQWMLAIRRYSSGASASRMKTTSTMSSTDLKSSARVLLLPSPHTLALPERKRNVSRARRIVYASHSFRCINLFLQNSIDRHCSPPPPIGAAHATCKLPFLALLDYLPFGSNLFTVATAQVKKHKRIHGFRQELLSYAHA